MRLSLRSARTTAAGRVGSRAILALASLACVSGGCSQTIRTLTIQSPVDYFAPSPRLCDLVGSRVAIVPGNAFASQERDAEQTFRTAPFASYASASASASGELRYRVDDGPWYTATGGSKLPPESISRIATQLTRMGFVVIDRQHIAKVLEEQDVDAVFGETAQSVGRLLGADVVIVVSTLLTPVVYFASYSGGYALLADTVVRADTQFIEVSTGASLGSATESGSLFSFCAYKSARARAVTGALEVRIEWSLGREDGTWEKADQIDFTAILEQVARKIEAERLAQWRELCGAAGSSDQEAKSVLER